MGVPPDVLGWYEKDNRTYDNMPIDEETKITIQDMKLKRDQFLQTDDFEGLKQIGIDLKKEPNRFSNEFFQFLNINLRTNFLSKNITYIAFLPPNHTKKATRIALLPRLDFLISEIILIATKKAYFSWKRH